MKQNFITVFLIAATLMAGILKTNAAFATMQTLDCVFVYRDMQSGEPMQGINSETGNNKFKIDDSAAQSVKILESQNFKLLATVSATRDGKPLGRVYLELLDKNKIDGSGNMGLRIASTDAKIGERLSILFNVDSVAYLWGWCNYL